MKGPLSRVPQPASRVLQAADELTNPTDSERVGPLEGLAVVFVA